MDVVEIFKDSLRYPLKDNNKLIMLGVLIIISGIIAFISGVIQFSLSQFSTPIYMITMILLFIISIIVSGYALSVVKETLLNSEIVPSIDLVKNLISGIKIAIVSIIYYLIPLVITLFVSYLNGTFNSIIKIITYSIQNFFNPNISEPILTTGSTFGLMNISILWFILSAITTLFLIIGIIRLAKNGNIIEALKMNEVFNDIKKIGIGNYIIVCVLYLLIGIIISFFSAIFILIPIIGIIVFLLVISPYIVMFSGRTFGLIYNESEN